MKSFITLNNISIRLKDKFLFEDTHWVMNKGEDWLIVGANGAGKTTLAKAIAGELPLKQGEIILNFLGDVENPYPSVHKDKISYLSFESHQKLVEQDNFKKDLQEFSGKKIKGMTVKQYLDSGVTSFPRMTSFWQAMRVQNLFNIEHLLNLEISTLSTGEARKVQIIHSLLKNPKLLILDEPFEGLDMQSKKDLTEIIENLKYIQLILITHRLNEIPKNISHIMIVENGQIKATGKKEDIKNAYLKSMTLSSDRSPVIPDVLDPESIKMDPRVKPEDDKKILEMKNVNVKIEKKQILEDINWTIKKGENWALLGPNGSGKSTLVKLILGEHPQAFSNNIRVFNKKIGEGVSVWDIKKNIGFISSELMLNYRKDVTAYQVLLSGFFDSIGLYQKTTKGQLKKADEWIQVLGIEDLIERNFNELSFGQKRLVLIARAVIKSPRLLILDEPCHGLDINNRKKILELIEKIGKTETNILLITHNSDEIVPSITHTLKLDQGRVIS